MNHTKPWMPAGPDIVKATTLQGMFSKQVSQQQLWHDWNVMTAEERAVLAKDLMGGLQMQVADLQRMVINDSYHILKSPPPLDTYTVAEAGVDVFKMLVALMSLNGVGPSDFIEAFNRKTAVVDDRWRCENVDTREVRVLMCDIDGVVADWTGGFKAFAAERGMANANATGVLAANSGALEDLKDEFHGTGGFLRLEAIPGAVEALTAIRASGLKLVMVTARPFRQYKRVYADTLEWFNSIGLEYDHIIFNRDKAEAARSLAPANIVAHIEDRPKHSLEVASLGIKVYQMPSDYNERVEHPLIVPVEGWSALKPILLTGGTP